MRCAAYGGLAREKPQSALRAFVRFFSGTFCPPLELLRNSFIAAVKTSHTTGTLYEKTVLFVLVCVLFTSALSAQQTEQINTSDGTYFGGIDYIGKNRGRERYNKDISELKQLSANEKKVAVQTDIKLTKGQWEAVNRLLGRYTSYSKGDTFCIVLGRTEGSGNYISYINFICEFTSGTQYGYWCYRMSITK